MEIIFVIELALKHFARLLVFNHDGDFNSKFGSGHLTQIYSLGMGFLFFFLLVYFQPWTSTQNLWIFCFSTTFTFLTPMLISIPIFNSIKLSHQFITCYFLILSGMGWIFIILDKLDKEASIAYFQIWGLLAIFVVGLKIKKGAQTKTKTKTIL